MKINDKLITPVELAEQMTHREIKELLSVLNLRISEEMNEVIDRLNNAKLWFNDSQLSSLIDNAICCMLLCAAEGKKEENLLGKEKKAQYKSNLGELLSIPSWRPECEH